MPNRRPRIAQPGDLSHLAQCVALAAGPVAVGNGHGALAKAIADALGVSRVVVSTAQDTTHEFGATDEGTTFTEAYRREWVGRDPFWRWLRRMGPGVATRAQMLSALRRGRFSAQADEVWRGFYLMHGAGNSLALLGKSDGVVVHAAAFHDDLSFAPFGSYGHALMGAVQPALLASARQRMLESQFRGAVAGLLDRIGQPLAVLEDGKFTHQSPTFRRRCSQAGLDDSALAHAATALWRSGARPGAPGSAALAVAEGSVTLVAMPWTDGRRLVSAEGRASAGRIASEHLTPRQLDVGRLIATGATTAEIAATLRVSLHTARRHTESVMKRLGVTRRAQVAAAMVRRDRR